MHKHSSKYFVIEFIKQFMNLAELQIRNLIF